MGIFFLVFYWVVGGEWGGRWFYLWDCFVFVVGRYVAVALCRCRVDVSLCVAIAVAESL